MRDQRGRPDRGVERRSTGPGGAVFTLDVRRAALVVTDPQVDFLSPTGVAWTVVGPSVERNHTVDNIERLLQTVREADMPIAISPHYFYPSDRGWRIGGPLETLMRRIGTFDRKRSVAAEATEESGADVMPRYKPYILAGKAIIASPHRRYGPESTDLLPRLRRQGVEQVLLAGMSANLCVEAHLRELLERGFEVAVVGDATAATTVREGDGYLAALVNFRYIADALWTTDEAVQQISHRA